jgi:uncharacterized membrane-anchored protein
MNINAFASRASTGARTVALLSCALLWLSQMSAVSAAIDQSSDAESLEKGLQWQEGEIAIGDNLAKLNIPFTFRFLGPADTRIVLTKLWANPPSKDNILGMIFPATIGPTDPATWGVVVTYEGDGYVKDNDATEINYNDLLKQLQTAMEDQNAQRAKDGYPAIHLTGWAAPPRYDREAHKLYWAKEISLDGDRANTLNYNIRVLGRRGVLVLNAVASMAQFQEIERQIPAIIAMTNFTPGNRYSDFTPGKDKMAEYGLSALILGGIAAKTGFFKALLLVLLAAKKFIIIGIAAIGTFLARILRRKKAIASLAPTATVMYEPVDRPDRL